MAFRTLTDSRAGTRRPATLHDPAAPPVDSEETT